MFNASQKEKFIDYSIENLSAKRKESGKIEWTNTFNRLEEVELALEKDFSYFNYSEMLLMLPMILVKSIVYQKQQLSLLRTYLFWAIDNGCSLDGENRLIGLSPKDIDFSKSYSMCMVKDESQLDDYFKKMLVDEDRNSADNIYRTLFLLIFNGVELNDAFNLRIDDVNFNDGTIKIKDRTVKVSQLCLNSIKYLQGMIAIETSDGKSRDIVRSGYVLENSSSDRNAMRNTAITYASTKFAELKRELGYPIAITFSSLWKSGVFYRAYQGELKNGEVDLSELGSSDDYKLEYGAWKKAFGI